MSVQSDVLVRTIAPAARRSGLLERRATGWQPVLVAASLVTAAAHVPVTGEHLEEAFYIGALFIALEVASVALAVILLRRPSRAALLASSLTGVLAVLALVLSRTVGLPLIGDDVGNWTEPLATISLVAELVMAIGGALAAARPASPPRAPRLAFAAGATALVLGAVTIGFAVTSAPAGHDEEGMTGMHMEGDMHAMEMD